MMSVFPFLPPSKSFYITLSPWSLSYSWTLFPFSFYVFSSCIKTRKTKVKITLTISFVSNISFLDIIFIIKCVIHEDNINWSFLTFPILSSEFLYIFIYNAAQLKFSIFQLLSGHIGQVAIHWTVQFCGTNNSQNKLY